MKSTLHKSILLLVVCISVCSFSACTVDTNNVPEHANLIEATASSMPVSSSSPKRSGEVVRHDDKSLSGFAQIWSTSNPSFETGDAGQRVSAQTEISAIYATHEYKQLRVIMNGGNYERAKRIASTPTLKAIVEQEYQMHLEMLDTERVTAKADHVHGTKEL